MRKFDACDEEEPSDEEVMRSLEEEIVLGLLDIWALGFHERLLCCIIWQ